MSEPDREAEEDEWDASGWFFGLISILVVTLVGAVAGLPWWAMALVAIVVGVLAGLAQRRWPTI